MKSNAPTNSASVVDDAPLAVNRLTIIDFARQPRRLSSFQYIDAVHAGHFDVEGQQIRIELRSLSPKHSAPSFALPTTDTSGTRPQHVTQRVPK